MERFLDRRDAGRQLARELGGLERCNDAVVLGLARGGIPVAYEVALALDTPLDVFIVRKLGVPWNEECGIGAVASGGTWVLDAALVRRLRIEDDEMQRIVARELRELARRERVYRGSATLIDVAGRNVILVDDGFATGSTMLAAIGAIRKLEPASIVAAAPVASRDAGIAIRQAADECIALVVPEPFDGVSAHYEDFTQTSDDEVLELLLRARMRTAAVGA